MTHKILVTGAAGFIGQAFIRHVLRSGRDVHLIGIDSLERPGVYPPREHERVEFHHARCEDIWQLSLPRVDDVLHLAAQTTVTRSITSPRRDFQANAMGSFEVALWAAQKSRGRIIYASTNKVLADPPAEAGPRTRATRTDAHTPYGISKLVGEAYFNEFLCGRVWIFRQSCVYGPSQQGSEDQGWVSWVCDRARAELPVTCYGDGTQIRDLLHVDDLLKLYDLILWPTPEAAIPPGAYVVGGGPSNAASFAEVCQHVGANIGAFEQWRPNDQRYFVSANDGLDPWKPEIDWRSAIMGDGTIR
jgi:CDP-paratose 2-epimerase